ncbi:MAG: phenylacetate--CoA ligase family protein [Chloroflexi bacterium]|nr:MAG: phenylacetate--CoA ligase family protein [Chloroflexota bacterium]
MADGIKRAQQTFEQLRWTGYLTVHIAWQGRVPFKSADALRRAQTRNVEGAIRHAYLTVPFYRDTMRRLGLTPPDIITADDLLKLPIVEREQVQRDPEYFTSEGRPLSEYLKRQSSGSTGAPITVFEDRGALVRGVVLAQRQRAILTSLVGRPFGYRSTMIAAPTSAIREREALFRVLTWFPRPLRTQRQFLSVFDPPEVAVWHLNEFRPHVIGASGSYLDALFTYLHETRAAFHRPKVVVFAGEGISDAVRRIVSREFGIPVLGLYQAVEVGNIAFECQHNSGYHVNTDICPLRIVGTEGEPLAPGEVGDVIVSNLVNRATVVLNYRLGDLASMLPEACGCGRTLPLLSAIEGRSDDWIELADGRQINPLSACVAFRKEAEVWRFRLTQRAPGDFRVAVVVAPDADRSEMTTRLRGRLQANLGTDAQVEIEFVDAIEPLPGGKHKAVVRKDVLLR